MMRTPASVLAAALLLGATLTASGGEQLGSLGKIGGAVKKANDVRDIQFTDAEEQQLGAAVSEKIRTRYGVVQDAGRAPLRGARRRRAGGRPARGPRCRGTFIVLDTDGVNAFAAPGGYVHITRGALALIQDEAELAGVLGHEIIHVTEKHTIKSMQKSKAVQMGASETLSGSSASARTGRHRHLRQHRREGLRSRGGERRGREGRWLWRTALATRRAASARS